MAPTITTEQRRRRLALRHRLAASQRSDSVLDIATSLVALHSSDPATVHLSATTRMVNPAISAVEDTLYDDRSVGVERSG